MPGSLEFFGIEAKPDEIVTGWHPVAEADDGAPIFFPVVTMSGSKPGPCLFLGAGIHGNEYNGVFAIGEVFKSVRPRELSGTIVAVPVQNPVAFHLRTRMTSINETDTLNMHRAFPGDGQGDLSQTMAFCLFDEILRIRPNCVIDLHTGGMGAECAPHVFLPSTGVSSDVIEESHRLGLLFGLSLVMRPRASVYSDRGWQQTELAQAGIPSFGVELGEGGRRQSEMVRAGCLGVLNVMRGLEMISGVATRPSSPVYLYSEVWVRSRKGGLVNMLCEPGESVKKGGTICEIQDVSGRVVDEVGSPADGVLIQVRRLATAFTGERLARVGLVDR